MTPRLVRSGISELVPITRTGSEDRHVSTIIRYLCIKLGHFTADGNGKFSTEQLTRMQFGSAFDDAVVEALANRYAESDPRYIRPGEFELNDLIGTPDLIDIADPDAWVVEEIKLTWASARHEPESLKFWRYWVQVMAYCKWWVRLLAGYTSAISTETISR